MAHQQSAELTDSGIGALDDRIARISTGVDETTGKCFQFAETGGDDVDPFRGRWQAVVFRAAQSGRMLPVPF